MVIKHDGGYLCIPTEGIKSMDLKGKDAIIRTEGGGYWVLSGVNSKEIRDIYLADEKRKY